MNYFYSVSNRVGTCYHEFYKGKWDGKTFWKSDSLLLHDDILVELELYKAFSAILPNYDPHGVAGVNQIQWKAILDYASQLNTEARIALNEASIWVDGVFENEEEFTILGI